MPWRLKTAAVRLGVACAILLVTNVWSAASSPITVEFGGFVTQFNTDPDDPFGGAVVFGTAITGTYTFESTTPDSIAVANAGSYQAGGAPLGLTVTIGGGSFTINDFLAVNVANDFAGPVDQYGVLACSGGAACSGYTTIDLFLQDNDATVFT